MFASASVDESALQVLIILFIVDRLIMLGICVIQSRGLLVAVDDVVSFSCSSHQTYSSIGSPVVGWGREGDG